MAEAATVIYWAAGCPYCLRAQIALHECDVPYKGHILDLWAGVLRCIARVSAFGIHHA